MKTLYFECNMGAAGDMLMSALYEVCEQKDLFLKTMNEVFAPFHIKITATEAEKCGIHGTKIKVLVHGEEEASMHTHGSDIAGGAQSFGHDSADSHDHEHSNYPSILKRIASLTLPDTVKEDTASIYQLIGEAEAKVHKTDLEQIHFHEVGSLDALADIAGCALLMYLIAPEQVFCSPVHVGTGFVKCAHGVLPVPAPATAELLKGITFYSGSISGDLLTPTGAAILKYYVKKFTSLPAMSVTAIGYGMGTKDFEIANCVRVFLGETYAADTPKDWNQTKDCSPADSEDDFFPSDDTILGISCNLDDMTGEDLGLATEILLAAGALDVYITPIQMKKNRPGILLTCLCNMEDREKFTGLFFLHTTTRGVRYQTYERAKLESTFVSRKSPYGDIRIKKSSGYGVEKEKPEFEDLKSIVLRSGCSIEEIKRNV